MGLFFQPTHDTTHQGQLINLLLEKKNALTGLQLYISRSNNNIEINFGKCSIQNAL